MDFFMTGADEDEAWPLIKAHHYSRRMPKNIQHVYVIRRAGGLFGDRGEPIAAAIFSLPPTRWSEEVTELSRLVRHPDCAIPLSKLLAFSCHWLKLAKRPLLVSFADRTQGHHGGIYQAAGWLYDGCRDRRMDGLVINGWFMPGRTCNHTFGTRSPAKVRELRPADLIEPHYDEGKHLYWKPLMVAGKTRAKRLGLRDVPYPKPNATRPVDEPVPTGARTVQPRRVAPVSS
jgi:hypothetical protein